MDIKKELEKNPAILLLVPAPDYGKIALDNARQLAGSQVGYVTLSKTFEAQKEFFGKNKVGMGNIVFIDGISKTFRHMPDQADACYFVSSPSSLTELQIAVIKLLRHGFSYIIFDSLGTLLVYQKNAPVARFASTLAANAKKSGAKILFYATKSPENAQMIEEVKPLLDKVIDLGARGPKKA